ncbi:PREDICTED: transmembrane protein 256 homolog isoform X1 [Dinoponera quadriceps]|uniref:Transmembrane protein 256 homolog isoform X1 n=1 Tax=Dinoponera quadriceps TaxID=609295 RepID=A0A6P3XG89_DINQU|nr:PREDICTED: transmembrane protein 256 homolog isoform X1 [Dinoponera quadriceps]
MERNHKFESSRFCRTRSPKSIKNCAVTLSLALGGYLVSDGKSYRFPHEMSLQDALYVVATAPFNAVYKGSKVTASYAWHTAAAATEYLGLKSKVEAKMAEPIPIWKLAAASGPYVKLAALSGTMAVVLGAIGSHRYYSKDEEGQEQRRIFETANRYHFIHTLALLGMPLCRVPSVAAILMLSGIVLFSGSCYYTAFTNDRRLSKLTPVGGFCLILGWFSMIF